MAEEAEQQLQDIRVRQAKRAIGELTADKLEEVVMEGMVRLSEKEADDDTAPLIDITDIAREIEEEDLTWGKVGGVSTGYPVLDARIGGMRPSQLILIAGKPKNGKSALAMNIAVNVAKTEPVLFITLEMLARQTGVRIKHMNGGVLPDPGKFFFQAEPSIDGYKYVEKLFRSGVAAGMKLVVLDYLQFLGRGMTNEEVAKMSQTMKKLAVKYEVPFIVVVSLRKGETKFNRKWTDMDLDDIMGTAAIGYDADTVLMASRLDTSGNRDNDHMYVNVVAVRSVADSEKIMQFDWDKTSLDNCIEIEKEKPKVTGEPQPWTDWHEVDTKDIGVAPGDWLPEA